MSHLPRGAMALVGVSLAIAFSMPGALRSPVVSQAATVAVQPSAVVEEPAKPASEGTGPAQKCHPGFVPLVEHRLRGSKFSKVQTLAGVSCRQAIGDVSVFAGGVLIDKFSNVSDVAASLNGADFTRKRDVHRGVCVDIEVDGADGRDRQFAQCFFRGGGILQAGGGHSKHAQRW